MKLIYLHQYFKFPDETGGTRSYDLATSFVKKGIEVVVVTATSDINHKSKKKWKVLERDGLLVNYIYLPYGNHLSYFQRSFVFFKFLWFSTFRLLKLKGDFVLATSTPLTIGIPALFKKWFGKTPYIFEVRDVWPEAVIAIGAIRNKMMQKLLYLLERVVYKNASAVVPLSTDMQKSIVNRYPQFTDKSSVVIENISEINRFQNIEDEIDLENITGFKPRFSVLYAGTFGKVNGIDKVIDLAKKTLQIDDKLVYILIGSGAEKDNIIQLAKDIGVYRKNVFILEPISKNELPKWYNSISIGSSFVIDIKELWANAANKFFDTLAAGKPILINHEGWQAEIIREYNVGYVLPSIITTADACKFVEYTLQTNLIQEQQKNAFSIAREKYSLERAVEKYMKVFDKVFK